MKTDLVLTSSAVAEERQDVLSKNAIDQMADAITGGNDIDLWDLCPANRFFLTLWWKVIFKTWCSTTQKRQKLVTEMYHKSYSSPQPQWRSSWQKLALFSLSQTCVKCLTCRLMCANTTKCAHFLIKKGIFDWKHVLERLRSHEHSMEHIDATITFSRRCNNITMKNWYRTSRSGQSIRTILETASTCNVWFLS